MTTPQPPTSRFAGWWYYVVLIGTVGVFAWVPFLHAAIRVRTARARLLALIFGGVDAVMYVLMAVQPQNDNGPVNTIVGLLALASVIAGCVLVSPLRHLADGHAPVAIEGPTADPAIQAALAARSRREEARKLATEDPLLAHELHIGRPDLTRTYDDGGLVDLNSAPADVIARVCDIPAAVAATIVTTRDERGEPFDNVDEVFVMADLPVSTWDRIRDRAVLLS
jgi:DNA uptake protein ComE-like DNA-binding protein